MVVLIIMLGVVFVITLILITALLRRPVVGFPPLLRGPELRLQG
jgi:hypothetical protein